MHHKPFGSWALSRPAGGAYSVPRESLAGLKVWGLGRGRGENGT